MAKKGNKEVAKTEPARAISPFDEMEKRFEDFFRKPFSLIGPTWWPRLRIPELEEISTTVDIYEEGGDVVIKADLPGMKKENIDVNISGDTVTISGEKRKRRKLRRRIITAWKGHTVLSSALFAYRLKCIQIKQRQISRTGS